MGEIRKTYDVTFKKKAVNLYLKKGMSYKSVGEVRNWISTIP